MGAHKKLWIGGAVLLLGGLLTAAGPLAHADQQEAPGTAGSVPYAPETVGATDIVDTVLSYGGDTERVLTYPGSDYVKVHFGRLLLADGDYVTVSDPEGRESYRYDGDDAGSWATSITGDQAVVALHRARETGTGVLDRLGLDDFGVRVDKVARGLTDAELAEHHRGPESLCGRDNKRDAVCYRESDPQAFADSAPVARLLIGGTTLCTAWRVGPHNRMLTNHHCLTTTAEARDTEVWFGYECALCGGLLTKRPVKVDGDKVLATDRTYDYTLFTVDDFDAVAAFGYLELDDRTAKTGEKLYIPQHPSGEPLQIAVDSDTDAGGYCRVEYATYQGYAEGTDVGYRCDTEFGSSGSPVIARSTGKVIALHHFGGCPNSGVRSDLLLDEIGDLL